MATDPKPASVLYITLHHGEHQDSTVYRFEKGTRLQFSPGSSLIGRKVLLYTNYVVDDNEDEPVEFVRNRYTLLEWRTLAADDDYDEGGDGDRPGLEPGAPLPHADLYCELTLRRAGSFHYYFAYETAEAEGSGWFGVAPTVRVGPPGDERVLPLAALSVQTALTKCLGPLVRWRRSLQPALDAGYSAVHFTPVQVLGSSRSSYCIADQLRLDPALGGTVAELAGELRELRRRGACPVGDVVLNHTAPETPGLRDHPDATYNCASCPYLRPAALQDALLARESARAARGDLAQRGIPPLVTSAEHLAAARSVLAVAVEEARLEELDQCAVEDVVRRFERAARDRVPGELLPDSDPLRLVPDPQRRRLRASVDIELALRKYHVLRLDDRDEAQRVRRGADELRAELRRLNAAIAERVRGDLCAAVDNCVAGLRYDRLEAPDRHAELTASRPLVPRYFTWDDLGADESLADLEARVYGTDAARVMAHNGWVMGADGLQDFAGPAADGRVYRRRELVAWGDSVKLRYGAGPSDAPWLWRRMREYVELNAELFDGLRLDNCHSTPLHVAEYLLDCARAVKPDLLVIAELFTDSHHVDNVFVNRLGITALVREAQGAGDARELGRLIHRAGGRPVGGWLSQGGRTPARACLAPAVLYDATHDNASPLERRCVLDVLPCAALLAAASCAAGSTRGVDQLVPHHVHVVDETRPYLPPDDERDEREEFGVEAARRVFNDLHARLALEGYSEVFVDQMDEDMVAVTRHNPDTRESVVVVSFTAFRAPEGDAGGVRRPAPLRVEGELNEILFEASLEHKEYPVTGRVYVQPTSFDRHPRYINGLRDYRLQLTRAVPLAHSATLEAVRLLPQHPPITELIFRVLSPGTVLAVHLRPTEAARVALLDLRRKLTAPPDVALRDALARLTWDEVGRLLFRCDAEEHEAGGGVYVVPGSGPLPYAGLAGVAALLQEAQREEAPAHALCDHLRAGDWLPEYACARLERAGGALGAVGTRLRELWSPLKMLPRFLVPAHWAALHGKAERAARREALRRVGGRIGLGGALALSALQLVGRVQSARLPGAEDGPTMSAGLPHFATGYMRCWGRDTFVSLRGLLLLTGRHAEARAHLLGFAACLRHGLIPNLLDSGRPRYNCRDAVWWWLLALKQYCNEVPDGLALLTEPVARLFPPNNGDTLPPVESPLHALVQEALETHFQGLTFREQGAGPAIDAHMTERGFVVQIGIHPETGFPFGGNDANCGTWMDKMGSSERAGTRGIPATPRDGSAVELVGLAYCSVTWLDDLHCRGLYPHSGVTRCHADGSRTTWTFAQWANRIRANFERHFWIPSEPSALDARPDLVHRRAIYKDSHGATQPWADYRLRCNFPIAMVVAPDLFDTRHAWLALDAVERHLLGPLGVKTLDPADLAYRPNYRNSDDSADPSTAHGFNYHQGPEWTWPLGYYLRARLLFARENDKHARTVAAVAAALGRLRAELERNPWRGLPELTDADGGLCPDSCGTQAWSNATALEVLHDLNKERVARALPAA